MEKIDEKLLDLYEKALDSDKDIYMIIVKLCSKLIENGYLTYKQADEILKLEDKKKE